MISRTRCFDVCSTTNGYPLKIEPGKVVVEKSPFDKGMVLRMLSKLNYDVVVQAYQQLVTTEDADMAKKELPEKLPDELDDELLQTLHHVIFDIHLVEGMLICPGSGRRFPVKDSIPNMILHADEL